MAFQDILTQEKMLMLYLILAIASSAAVSLVMRLSERYCKGSLTMLAANYVMCTLAAFVLAGSTLAPAGLNSFTLALGGVNGLLYLLGFVLLQWNIGKSGVVLPATFGRLGVLVPTIAAITIFGDQPRVPQFIGIAAAIGAILLMQGKSEQSARGNTFGLMWLLINSGVCDLMSKVFETWGNAAHNDHFLLYTFITATALNIILCALKREKPTRTGVLWGLALGVPNYLSARFLLLSLTDVPAVVAYPTYSVGAIVAIALVGVLGFKEKLNFRKWVAMGMILAALALLNL